MACSLAPEVLVRGVLEYDLISTPLDANGLSNAKDIVHDWLWFQFVTITPIQQPRWTSLVGHYDHGRCDGGQNADLGSQ